LEQAVKKFKPRRGFDARARIVAAFLYIPKWKTNVDDLQMRVATRINPKKMAWSV